MHAVMLPTHVYKRCRQFAWQQDPACGHCLQVQHSGGRIYPPRILTECNACLQWLHDTLLVTSGLHYARHLMTPVQ